jgi:hypothetical protein
MEHSANLSWMTHLKSMMGQFIGIIVRNYDDTCTATLYLGISTCRAQVWLTLALMVIDAGSNQEVACYGNWTLISPGILACEFAFLADASQRL